MPPRRAQGVAPELRAELWPLLLGVFPPGANEDERLAVVAGLHKQYIKLVRVCAEMEKQVAAAKQEQQQQQQRWEEGGATPEGAAVANAPEPEPLPAGLASFVEAHRVAVLDAVRTSFPQQPLEGRDGGGGEFGPAAAALGSPTVTVLPVAVVDGLPEYVFVERPAAPEPGPEPGGAAGAAAPQPAGQHGAAASAGSSGDDMHGNMPLWTSALAAEALEHATHVPGPAKRQMLRLINLLTAYAIHDPEVAYCQGMCVAPTRVWQSGLLACCPPGPAGAELRVRLASATLGRGRATSGAIRFLLHMHPRQLWPEHCAAPHAHMPCVRTSHACRPHNAAGRSRHMLPMQVGPGRCLHHGIRRR